MSQHNAGAPEGKGPSPVGYVLIGLFFYAVGVGLFFYFAHLESTGESISMNAVVALLYNLGGKWLVAAVSALIGTLSLVVGVAGMLRGRREGG